MNERAGRSSYIGRAILTAVITAAVTLAMVAALVFVLAFPARADDTAARLDWIHKHARHCCDHRDCGPRALTMTFTGWKAEGGDNVVPFAQVIPWPFSGPWACVVNRHTRCVLARSGS